MAAIEKRTFDLPAEHAAFIDAKVTARAFASASDVVRAGLRALQEQDAVSDRWLREDVSTVYDAMRSDPSRAIPAKSVFDDLRDYHTGRVEGGA